MVNKKVLAVALFTTIFSGNAVSASPIIPGGTAEAILPSENTWGFDSDMMHLLMWDRGLHTQAAWLARMSNDR